MICWIGGMLGGLVGCWVAWKDVEWVGRILDGLVGCWAGWWDVMCVGGMCGLFVLVR